MRRVFEASIRRSLLFIILIFTVAIFGVYTFLTIDQREIPETEVNLINVTTAWPGADKRDVETNITEVMEAEIFSVDGVDSVSSVSQDGVSVLTLELSDAVESNDVVNAVNNLAGGLSGELPENAAEPEVRSIGTRFPLLSYQFHADERAALDDIRSDLETLERDVLQMEGIEGVTVKGYADETYVIALDRSAMVEANLNPNQILTEIEGALNPVILGQEKTDGDIIRLSFQDEVPMSVLEQVRVGSESVPLSEMAEIERQPADPEDIVQYEGSPAVSFTVFLASGEDVPSVSREVEAVMDEGISGLPDGIEATNISSERENVEDIFTGLYMSLAIALIAVILSTSLGLSLSGSVTVMTTVVLSVVIGLIPVPWFGVDLNQISVIGLIIALGILVDDSIVVNDNIERRFTLGDGRLDGVYNGVKEVAPSVISSTLAIVFTFSPLLLLSGANGEFIKALPSILITTMIVSTVLALTFVPAARYLLKQRKVPEYPGLLGRLFTRGGDFYADKVLPAIIRRPLITFLTVLVIGALSLGLIRFTPFEFFPEADRSEVTVDLIFDESQTIGQTHEDANAVLDHIKNEMPHVEASSLFTGTGLPNLFGASLDQSGPNTAQIALEIDKTKQSASETIDQYEAPLREAFPEATIFMETIVQGPPASAPVTVELYEPDIEQLNAQANELESMLEEDGALVTTNLGESIPTLTYQIDHQALEENGISISQVKNELNMLSAGIPIQGIIADGEPRETTLKYSGASTIENTEIVRMTGAQPETYPLSDFVEVSETESPKYIHHRNGDRMVELQVYAEDEAAANETIESFRDELPDSSEMIIGGETSDQTDFFIEISILFGIILILVYLVIAVEFNSIVMPLIIVFSIFLAISGGIIGLFVTQTPISFLGIMGMVSLSGIVVRNAIVLLDFIEARRQSDAFDINEAIYESGRARFKPILLTTITSIIALTPVALGGDALFVPLAVTVIAGIAFSTILSMIATPSLYYLYYRIRYRK
ncbi:efflux RND transporter permease subunit [Salinicoccus cyprini]|uniref:Efflux RND transporter permease subunit n=1 Tax=Salinicoccus cyprini TaxID=2493691 RepID=A0A558AU96_9STAP|nr:efflux RND transporter permease subunit [Salinicoccus cyprini]TVT27829.1 efflux RND transporter permease subunit [Salinicoccus cyprini]